MPDSPSICVVDTSVLIDLHAGEVLQAVFRLPITLMAPDVIIAELLEPSGQLLVELGLTALVLTGSRVERVYHLRGTYRRVSANDLFALVAAEACAMTLLTSDRHLRQVAEQLGVSVHGTLWLLEEMVRHGVLSRSLARDALERMLQRGRRLPREECERCIKEWRAAPRPPRKHC